MEPLRRRVAEWTTRGVYFGTSSWKYEGWLGQVYTRERYLTRGRFSKPRFERECLAEYAETFPTVCGDFSFYQFYASEYWNRLFAQVPPTFRFGFKVPEMITAPVLPAHERYGKRGGQTNEQFLDVDLLKSRFLDRLEPHRAQVGYLVFQFPQFAKKSFRSEDEFIDRLDRCLEQLPGTFQYGVEVRNESLLRAEYFECLRRHRVAHVFNSWTRMPTIGEQLQKPSSLTADHVIARALLKPGRTYEQAVNTFQPYDKVKDPYPEGYRDVADLVRKAAERPKKPQVFIAINNRFVGNAIMAINEILDVLAGPKRRPQP